MPHRLSLRSIGLASVLLLSACVSPSEPDRVGQKDCVVATIGGERIAVADVEGLAAIVQPGPTGDAAKRWAIDVALARWTVAGRIGDATARAQLDSYRRLLGELGDDEARLAWRARAATQADLLLGPCGPDFP